MIGYLASDQITGYARIFFFHSVLYCVLLTFDTGCDNRNWRPRRGHHRAPGHHYQNWNFVSKFQIWIVAAGGPVVPPPGSLISIVTPSIKDQEHTIEHAVKKELIRSESR